MATLTPRAACALRLMLAWALLSGLGFWHGETLFAASTALMTEAVHWIEPRLASSVQLTTASADAALVLDASVAMPLALDNERAIPTGTTITPQNQMGRHRNLGGDLGRLYVIAATRQQGRICYRFKGGEHIAARYPLAVFVDTNRYHIIAGRV